MVAILSKKLLLGKLHEKRLKLLLGNANLNRELAKLDSLKRRLNEIEPKDLGAYDQEQLERVKQRIEELTQDLPELREILRDLVDAGIQAQKA